MTRDEIRIKYKLDFERDISLAKRIIDDFEKEPMVEQLNNECIRLRKELEEIKSRTCENCKYLYIDYGRQACKQEMPVWNLSNGCDALERKE